MEGRYGFAPVLSVAAGALGPLEKTRGAEHLKDILTGNLLWVKWSDVGLAAGIYSVVGLVHFVFRRKFLLISEDPEEASAELKDEGEEKKPKKPARKKTPRKKKAEEPAEELPTEGKAESTAEPKDEGEKKKPKKSSRKKSEPKKE